MDMRVNTITSNFCVISSKIDHLEFENYFEYLKINAYRDPCTNRNSFWMIARIVSLFWAKHRKLVPKFHLRGRDFDEKEREETEEESWQRRDGHVQREFDARTFAPVYSQSRSRTLYDARTIGENRENRRYPCNNGLSVAVSCQRTRVARSPFTGHTREHVSFVVPVIDSAISCIFTFLSSDRKCYSFQMLGRRQYFREIWEKVRPADHWCACLSRVCRNRVLTKSNITNRLGPQSTHQSEILKAVLTYNVFRYWKFIYIFRIL